MIRRNQSNRADETMHCKRPMCNMMVYLDNPFGDFCSRSCKETYYYELELSLERPVQHRRQLNGE